MSSQPSVLRPVLVPTRIPPKISVRPRPRAGSVLAGWEVDGKEARPGTAGLISYTYLVPVRRFLIELESNGIVASFPVDAATLFVRSSVSSPARRIDIVRDSSGVLMWKLDGAMLATCDPRPGGADSCSGSGLPAEFFGELCGMFASSGGGILTPRLVIDW